MMASHFIKTEIEIDASAEQVWSVLSDFDSYPKWNPFIKSAVGQLVKGKRLKITIQPKGAKPMRFSPKIFALEPGREIRWLGRLIVPGIFDGEHAFIIETLAENRVRFEQSERFSGLLVAPLRAMLERDTKRGFADMNQALKIRAEALTGQHVVWPVNADYV